MTKRSTPCLSIFIAAGVSLVFAPAAAAKPGHLAKLKALLISRTARCTSCHGDASGSTLNLYGKRLSEMSKSKSQADRLVALESPKRRAQGDETAALEPDQDVDGDQTPNWVEILAQTDPADKKSKPPQKTVERIERVVSCTICHASDTPKGRGLEGMPHNELGKLLAKTLLKKVPNDKLKNPQAVQDLAEATPILARLAKVKNAKPRGGKVSFWMRLRTLHPAADLKDEPTRDELKTVRKDIARRKAAARNRKSQKNLGIDCEAHRLDGFLLDAAGLD